MRSSKRKSPLLTHQPFSREKTLFLSIFLICCLFLNLSACATIGSLSSETKTPPNDPETDQLILRGDTYRERGELRQANMQYEQELKKRPNDPAIIYKIGLISLASDRKDDAMKDFNKAVSISPDFAPAYEGIGDVLFRKGDMDKALEAFQKALSLNPTLWNCHNKMGLIYDRRGKHDQAIQEYHLAISLQPQNGSIFNNLGVSYTYNSQYDAAIIAFNRSIDLHFTDKKVYNNLALALGNAERYDAALEAFRKSGSEAQALNNMGVVYLNKRLYPEAIQSFEKAIALEPTFYVTAGENLKKARLALEQR